jgi:hypothetical protein
MYGDIPDSCLCLRMTSLCVLVQLENSLRNRSVYRLESFEAQGVLLLPVLQSWLSVLQSLLTPMSYVGGGGMKLPPCAKPPLTVAHSSATASHPRRSERLMWIKTRSLPCSFLMTRGETPTVTQPPVLCRTIKKVFLRTPRRTISSFV